MNKKVIIGIILVILAAVLIFCAVNGNSNKDDKLYQVSLLQSFMQGEYEGFVTVGDLKTHGDTGLGTFDSVNGEMIVLDGVVYQAKSDGSVNVMPDNETIPFATVTKFDCDDKISDFSAKDFENLTNHLTDEIKKYGENKIYVAKIDADCKNITVRSVVKQKKPYEEFTKVAAKDQRVFNYLDQNGTIVAIYFPEYMDKLNMHGWHLHFLSDDKTKGGHVLNLTNVNINGELDEINEFDMVTPDTDSFNGVNLNENMTDKINSVE